MNRRQSYRANALHVGKLRARFLWPDVPAVEAPLFDVSYEGVGFTIPLNHFVEDEHAPALLFRRNVQLRCELSFDGESCVFSARVAWSTLAGRSWRGGLQFMEITRAQGDFARRVMARLQQLELRQPLRRASPSSPKKVA